EERDDGRVSRHGRRHEVHAVDLDLRVVGGGGAAEDEDVLAGAENEQVAKAPFQTLGLERGGDHGDEQERSEGRAHGGSRWRNVPPNCSRGARGTTAHPAEG